jgi:hypothetical protein
MNMRVPHPSSAEHRLPQHKYDTIHFSAQTAIFQGLTKYYHAGR